MTMAFPQTTIEDGVVHAEGWYDAAPERVYRAWTEPDALKRWFGRPPAAFVSFYLDLRPGGAWRFTLEDSADRKVFLEGEYLEILPSEKLVFTWSHVVDGAGGREATSHSQVTVDFVPEGRGTRLSVRHEGIQTKSGQGGVRQGWTASLERLATVVSHDGKEDVR